MKVLIGIVMESRLILGVSLIGCAAVWACGGGTVIEEVTATYPALRCGRGRHQVRALSLAVTH